MAITIKRNGEEDTILIHDKTGTQHIDMSGLEGKPRTNAIQEIVNWWCRVNKFKELY